MTSRLTADATLLKVKKKQKKKNFLPNCQDFTVRKKPINSKFKCSGLKPWHIKDPHEIHPNQQKNGQVPEFLLRKSTFYIYYC